jgi:hypothetical protein
MPESVVTKSEDSAKATRGRRREGRREEAAVYVLALERKVVRVEILGEGVKAREVVKSM